MHIKCTLFDVKINVCVLQGALRPVHAQALHVSATGLLPTPSLAVQIPTAKVSSARNALRVSQYVYMQPCW